MGWSLEKYLYYPFRLSRKMVKISISVNEEILNKVDEEVKEGTYRNRSHAFDIAAKRLISKQET